jgi:hypothetical protein
MLLATRAGATLPLPYAGRVWLSTSARSDESSDTAEEPRYPNGQRVRTERSQWRHKSKAPPKSQRRRRRQEARAARHYHGDEPPQRKPSSWFSYFRGAGLPVHSARSVEAIFLHKCVPFPSLGVLDYKVLRNLGVRKNDAHAIIRMAKADLRNQHHMREAADRPHHRRGPGPAYRARQARASAEEASAGPRRARQSEAEKMADDAERSSSEEEWEEEVISFAERQRRERRRARREATQRQEAQGQAQADSGGHSEEGGRRRSYQQSYRQQRATEFEEWERAWRVRREAMEKQKDARRARRAERRQAKSRLKVSSPAPHFHRPGAISA